MAGASATRTSVRVALLSDIHIGNRAMTPSRLASIADEVTAHHPDLILLARDFVVGHDSAQARARATSLIAPLSHLHAPLGVIAVLGNHDYWTDPHAVRMALRQAGITVLDNQAARRGPLTILGIGDRYSKHDAIGRTFFRARAMGGVRIVLTHSPDLTPELPDRPLLVLAGHTHCGQAVLPVVGPLVRFAPADHGRRLHIERFRCGMIRDNKRTIIVTAGVGSGTSPVRLGAPPDWWLITLTT